MIVNHKTELGWQNMNLDLGTTTCPKCDTLIEMNKWKKQDKHPDFRCGSKECGNGFWKPKQKTIHGVKPSSDVPTMIMISKILETCKEILKYVKPEEKTEDVNWPEDTLEDGA